MADDAVFASRSENKRKYDETGAAPPPRRVSGFSSPPADYHPPASSTPPSYNSVPPQPDGIQIAKQRAQEIAARLLIDAEAKRPRTENGGSGEDFGVKDHLHKPSFANSYSSNNSSTSFSSYGYSGANKKIEVPNGKVGVIIGKSGETIKYLQLQSGAKIQVTRDAEVDPYSQTRTVEISGTSEQVSKAEQLINDVLKEADAGMVSTKKYAGIQAGGEQFVMKVPNNKVGLVIGKGGEMIKGMQAKSGARIQIIPLHLPPGDTSTERTVQIDGTSEQIEAAKQLVNEVISDNRMRNPSAGGGYSQPGYSQPRPPTSWAPPGPPPTQPPSYGYMQTGAYPGPPPHYPPMSQPQYASYPPSSGGYPVSNASYDYYGQQLPPPPPISSSSAPEASGGYSQGQHQPSYSQDPYSESQHTAPQPQGYGQDSSYSSSGYPPGPQAGYTHPPSSQHVYDQQQNYGPPAGYDSSSAPPVYGTQPATASQGSLPPPPPLQGYGGQPPSSTLPPSYPSHQASGQQSQPGYGVPPPSQPGYGSQPPSTGYGQAGYVQQKAPTGPPGVYGQGQPGYGPPGQSQPGYAQSSASQPGYGSYGQPQPGYGGPPPPYDAYGSAPVGAGYSQPPVGYSSDGSATASVQAPFDATSAPAAKAPQS